MKRARSLVLFILLFSLILPGLMWFMPAPEVSRFGPDGFKFQAAITMLLAWLHVGAAILFVAGLDGFKATLKRAYFAICLGLVVTAVAVAQLPLIAIFNLWNSPWALKGGLTLPMIGTLLIYAGVYTFARALQIRHVPTSPWVVVPLFVVAAGAVGLAMDPSFDLTTAGYITGLILGTAIVWLTFRIKQTAGPAYTNALAWFMLPPLLNTCGVGLLIIWALAREEAPWYAAIPFAFVGALYVKAGYAFNKIKEY
ncbi:MAG TPA: hypothetical protein VLA88_03710 [Candidatus Saccharimonadales bacterium]|nr:hypothetical protein [Candidatus Saccharimonadales bacterium]